MREFEAIGKSVDEAIQSGLNTLGVARDQVEIHVIDEGSRGFLGIGFRHARVRLVSRVESDEQSSSELVRSWLGLDCEADDTGDSNPGHGDEADSENGQLSRPSPSPAPQNMSPGHQYLRGLIDVMGMEAEIVETESDGITLLEVEGKALGVLIGRHGETLDAIQYLVNLSANKQMHIDGEGERARYVVDVAGYRRKREEELRQLALSIADRVKREGKDQALEPMSALERRVVHLTLKDVEGIATHSEGREPFRRIVVSRSEATGE